MFPLQSSLEPELNFSGIKLILEDFATAPASQSCFFSSIILSFILDFFLKFLSPFSLHLKIIVVEFLNIVLLLYCTIGRCFHLTM